MLMGNQTGTSVQRLLAAALLALVLPVSVWTLQAQTPPEMQRIPFQIATGPISGSYLPAGEALAVLISHPPGLARCDTPGVCGPLGLIATTRSSSGSVSNAMAVERGSVQSAILQGDVAAAAFAGTGPFAQSGPLKDLRVIARLHDDSLHIVVSSRSKIRRLKDLDGRRVAIDSANGATETTVRQLLKAAGVPFGSLKIRRVAADKAAEDLQDNRIDAFFVLGVAPVRPVDQLMRRGFARLLTVDARTMQKLVRQSPLYRKTSLPSGTYRGSKTVAQLGVGSLWVVHRSLSDQTVFQILRALWNPANQADLRSRSGFGPGVELHLSPENVPLPLHDGAKRFYASAQR